MKAIRYLFITIIVFSTNYCFGQKKTTYSHLLELNNGASFKIQIVELNDSVLIYNSSSHLSSIRLTEVKRVVLMSETVDKVNAFGSKYGISEPKYVTADTGLRKYSSYMDTSTIQSASLNGTFFLNFGVKFGLVSEDFWTYPTSSFLFDFGRYWKLTNHHYLGPSLGLHPFAEYNSVTLPIKVNYKYVLTPNKNKSMSLNLQGGYSLALLENKTVRNGGFNSSFSISRCKIKTPRRVNEINVGFCYDRFEATSFVWDPITRTNQSRLRYVSTNRFFISKTWWFH